VTVTPKAAPSPLLVTVIVKPIWSPALTTGSSAVFVMRMSGQSTTIEASSLFGNWSFSVSSFEEAASARFGMVPQSAASVSPVRVTDLLRPSLIRPNWHERTSGVPSMIWHCAALAPPTAQSMPAGRSSVRVTSNAAPGPWLVTVMVKTAS
jgi:hypothetical protein